MPLEPPELEARAQQLARTTLAAVDDLLSRHALALVNRVAARRKVSPYHVALLVPGLCHTHPPHAARVDECAYCRRRGNCFA